MAPPALKPAPTVAAVVAAAPAASTATTASSDPDTGSTATTTAATATSALDSSNHLTRMQQQRVDATFEDLFGYPWRSPNTNFTTSTTIENEALMDRNGNGDGAAVCSTDEMEDNESAPRLQDIDHHYQILQDMLGPTRAIRILRRMGLSTQSIRNVVVQSSLVLSSSQSPQQRNRTLVPSNALQSLKRQPAMPKVAISGWKQNGAPPSALSVTAVTGRSDETSSAGVSTESSSQTTTRAVAAAAGKGSAGGGTSGKSGGGASGKSGGGVDALLQQMNAKSKISTVAKTSADWDTFKHETGLGATLEEQADSSTAYLKQQDFKHRVDHRTFELERQERDKQRHSHSRR